MNTYDEYSPVRQAYIETARLTEQLRARLGDDARHLVVEADCKPLSDDVARVDLAIINAAEKRGVSLLFRSDRLGSEATRELIDAALYEVGLSDQPGHLPDSAAGCSQGFIDGVIERAEQV